jgi:hypothetical protein
MDFGSILPLRGDKLIVSRQINLIRKFIRLRWVLNCLVLAFWVSSQIKLGPWLKIMLKKIRMTS